MRPSLLSLHLTLQTLLPRSGEFSKRKEGIAAAKGAQRFRHLAQQLGLPSGGFSATALSSGRGAIGCTGSGFKSAKKLRYASLAELGVAAGRGQRFKSYIVC